MIKHIVMWKLKEENKQENAKKIKSMLEALVGVIKEIKTATVGIDMKNEAETFDAVLVSTFENAKDLEAYRVHPKHVEIANFIKTVRVARSVVDYEF